MFEQPSQFQTVRPPEDPALDKRWYARFEEIGAFQAYEYLDGDSAVRAEEKGAFLTNAKENPDLDYPLLEEGEVLARDHELYRLKKEVIANEKNEVVKNVYRWRINEKIAENRLLLATATGDMRRFRRYSEFIYGKPSKDIFNYTLGRVRRELEAIGSRSEFPLAREKAIALLHDLPEVVGTASATGPNTAHLPAVKVQTEHELGNILSIPNTPEKLTDEEIRSSFESALDSLSAEGWIAVIDPKRTGVSVNQEKKAVQAPPDAVCPRPNSKGSLRMKSGLTPHVD